MSESRAIAHDNFRLTINGIWAAVISGRLSDDDGWEAVLEALTELREELGLPESE
ncbi:hypothetical protein [Streptomyces asiaticus]|uniref:hypothetical protein n=1 Tax=Streptomyces asiaticus TaxID=114695 RepID=UPI001BACB9BA|nr:hypothetical protein [Streptomyces asiaticus]